MAILVVAALVDLAIWPAGFVLQGIDRHRWLAPVALVSGAANLVLSIALAAPFGIVGVAIGTLIPAVVEAVVVLTPFTLRTLRIPPRRFFLEALGPLLVATIPMVVVQLALLTVLGAGSSLSLLIQVVVAHGVFGLVYLACVPARRERALIGDLVMSVTRRGRRAI